MEHKNTRTSQIERLARNGLDMDGDCLDKGELLSLRGQEEVADKATTSHADGNDVSYTQEDDSMLHRPKKQKRRSRRLGSSDTCCSSFLKCLGLVPCPSLLSWIILLCGIGCLTGSLLVGTWRTRDLLKDDELLWFMEYTIIGVTIGMFVIGTLLLTTGHLSSEPTSRRIFNSLTKNRCAQGLNIFALVVTYILTITWTLISVVLGTPLVLIINILIVGRDSVDPSLYGFKRESDIMKSKFHEDGMNLLITYAVALFGSLLIVNSMICFLITISANITHLRDNRFATLNTYSPGEEIHCSKHSVVDTNM